MMVGIGLFSVITTHIAAFFVEEDESEVTALRHRLAHMEDLLEALAADRGVTVPTGTNTAVDRTAGQPTNRTA